MSAFSGAKKRRKQIDLLNTQKERTLALQVDKRTKKVRVLTEDSDEEDADDMDLSIIIKSMKKFWKNQVPKEGSSRNFRGNSSRASSGDSSSRDLKDVTCYNCEEKGHYSGAYPKKGRARNS